MVGDPDPMDNTEPHFLYDLEYDPLGRVTSRSYPRCTHKYCIDHVAASDRFRTVTQGFEEGLMTRIDGFAPAIRYHSNQTVKDVEHTNGVT